MKNQANEPVTFALVGAGNRGAEVYAAALGRVPQRARLVAVAEPRPAWRERVAREHGIPERGRFARWEELLSGERLADALIIATPDRLHVAPTLRALELGYAVLLEKPIAPTFPDVLALAETAKRCRGSVTVAHVLRHSAFFSAIKRLLDEGRIGRTVSVQHTENIGSWHFAHSYVRGNWRREAESAPMILAKACHDLDLLRWLIGTPCLRLTSYGGLMHFRPENAPPGATARCTDGCALVRSCPYSAPRIYLERFGARAAWPNTVLTAHPDPGTLARALAEGPYGRCVYHCDNDVADHQVVAFEFEGGVTASLTVSAFTERNTRTLHIMGTHGELHGDMESGEIILQGFGQDGAERIQAGGGLGHREADEALILDFLAQREAARAGAPASDALTALDASIESHVMAFAAEASRRGAGAVELASFLPA